jgi:hypothetical protein
VGRAARYGGSSASVGSPPSSGLSITVTCTVLVRQIILTSDKKAREVKDGPDVALTVKNGRNWTNHAKKGCVYKKSGAVRLKKGTPPTMFLSYVATALRSCAAADGSNKWRADPGYGFLKAGVRR